jgi:hypothetical protein
MGYKVRGVTSKPISANVTGIPGVGNGSCVTPLNIIIENHKYNKLSPGVMYV